MSQTENPPFYILWTYDATRFSFLCASRSSFERTFGLYLGSSGINAEYGEFITCTNTLYHTDLALCNTKMNPFEGSWQTVNNSTPNTSLSSLAPLQPPPIFVQPHTTPLQALLPYTGPLPPFGLAPIKARPLRFSNVVPKDAQRKIPNLDYTLEEIKEINSFLADAKTTPIITHEDPPILWLTEEACVLLKALVLQNRPKLFTQNLRETLGDYIKISTLPETAIKAQLLADRKSKVKKDPLYSAILGANLSGILTANKTLTPDKINGILESADQSPMRNEDTEYFEDILLWSLEEAAEHLSQIATHQKRTGEKADMFNIRQCFAEYIKLCVLSQTPLTKQLRLQLQSKAESLTERKLEALYRTLLKNEMSLLSS
eukprot:TRINITY_DN192_c0_g1_i2.p1 TRINITY_DN192_c0_g1~~TRINITY_DN192_c0_g1_i2.p1  ORF type:complete len:374 (-),score=66.10 TRINITY_DN192_c0_g1_i2:95-1216(-)